MGRRRETHYGSNSGFPHDFPQEYNQERQFAPMLSIEGRCGVGVQQPSADQPYYNKAAVIQEGKQSMITRSPAWTLIVLGSVLFALTGCGGGGGGGTVWSAAPSPGPAPSADAGKDQVVNKYTPVVLSAAGSSAASEYKWTQKAGPPLHLQSLTSSTLRFTPLSQAVYAFKLEARNNQGSSTDEVQVTVQDISTVLVDSPTTDSAVAVQQSIIDIGGTSGIHINQVEATNQTTGSGYSGALYSDGTFTVNGIALAIGDNHIRVVGTDNTGARSFDTLLVTRNQFVNFLSSPDLSKEAAFTDEATEVVVTVAIEENASITGGAVTLLSVDGAGSETTIGTLFDSGDVANGDDVAGDSVYSIKTTITKSQAGTYMYRVRALGGYSAPVYFTVLSPLSDQEIGYADQTTESAFDDNFPSVGSSFTSAQFAGYKEDILRDLLLQHGVVRAELSQDGNSIVVEFESGLTHSIDFVYLLDGTDYRTQGGGEASAGKGDSVALEKMKSLKYYRGSPVLFGDRSTNATAGTSRYNSIGSYRAMAVSPFYWQFDPWDANDAYSVIEDSDTPKFTAEGKLVDYEVTVEHFRNLENYGVVLINSHGGLEGSTPVIYTGEEATTDKQKTYQEDIDAKRLLISHKIEILVKDGGWLWFDSKEKKTVFKVAPSFITKHNDGMPNSLVYIGICNGISTDALANAFLSAGAGAVVGFTDVVYTTYNYDVTETLLEEMVRGRTVHEAVDAATAAHGANDSVWAKNHGISDDGTPAAFVFRGNGDLILERTGIQNGGFEENLKYWEQNGGDVRILAKLSSLTPPGGTYMSILSSGLGSVTDSDAIITQQFKIPSGAKTLSFRYDVVSEEPLEFVGSSYDDKFEAVLIEDDGDETQLAFESINSSSWTAISGSHPDGGMFDGGDRTAFHTGWKTVNYSVSSLAGKTVTLKFRVWDVGDSIYDTAVVLDNVTLD